MKYDYKAVEAKWQKVWEDEKTFHVEIDHKKPKFYALVEFPYPSGAGLHVGHPRSYTALDVVSRKRRQNGYNVLYPMGWDAFGLPTENFAMKNHIHPAIVTKKNVDHFREQLKALGFSFDWDREINTTDPEYYKWTQWIFLQLYKKGLAYKKECAIGGLIKIDFKDPKKPLIKKQMIKFEQFNHSLCIVDTKDVPANLTKEYRALRIVLPPSFLTMLVARRIGVVFMVTCLTWSR